MAHSKRNFGMINLDGKLHCALALDRLRKDEKLKKK